MQCASSAVLAVSQHTLLLRPSPALMSCHAALPVPAGCAATRGNFFAHALTAGAPVDQPAAEHPASGAGPGRALHEAQQSRVACQQNPDEPLSQAITSCLHWQQQQVGCALLEAQGYLAGGVQSLLPDALSGTFPVPDSCGSTDVSLVLKQQQLRFDAGGRSVLAVIAKGAGSSAFFFSRGTSKVSTPLAEWNSSCQCTAGTAAVNAEQSLTFECQGRRQRQRHLLGVGCWHHNVTAKPHSCRVCDPGCLTQGLISLREQPTSLELCLSPPGEGSVQAQQTAAYSPRLAAGSVSWQLKKSVQLPPAFADGVVQMLQGDTVVSGQLF
jgi:hypothetical protein